MNGVNYMLLFVIVGGILIVISFVFGIDVLNFDFDLYNVFVVVFLKIGGDIVFGLMVLVFVVGIVVFVVG